MAPLDAEALAGVLEDVPVFPLPGVVLFPGQRLPFHIFEPRYRAMVRDLLGSGAPYLVVSCILGEITEAVPGFCSVAGLGRVVGHQRLPDGRFNILVEGVGRVRVEERPFVPPYRRVRAVVLPDPDPPEVDPLSRSTLLAVAAQYLASGRTRPVGVGAEASGAVPSALLCLRLAERVVSDSAAKQAILESDTAELRVRRTIDALALELLAAQGYTATGEG